MSDSKHQTAQPGDHNPSPPALQDYIAALQRRDFIMEAVAYAAECFLRKTENWEVDLMAVLERLGSATKVCRIQVFENQTGDGQQITARLSHEWRDAGIEASQCPESWEELSYQEPGLRRWYAALKEGETFVGYTNEFGAEELSLPFLEASLSVVALPIFAGDDWWGFMVLFDCRIQRDWSASEIGALKTAANIIGAGIQHHLIEASLREREKQYQSIFESVDLGLIINSMDGRIVEANPAACRMNGYTQEEFYRLDPLAVIRPDQRHLFSDFIENVASGGQFETEAVNVRKDGSEFDVEVRGTQFMYRGEPYVLGMVRDITARKNAERALREQESLLRHILEILPVGVWILDQDGVILSGNEAGRKIWGGARYVGIEQYGAYVGWWADTKKLIAPEEWAAARAITKGETSINEVIHIQCFDGSYKTILNSGLPIYDSNQRIKGAIIVNQDITESMRAQATLEEREQQYRSIFESTSDGLFINNLEGELVDYNPAAARMHGYTPEEFRLLQPSDFIHPDSFHVFSDYIEVLKAGRDFRGRAVDVCKSGKLIDVEVLGTAFIFHGQPHTLAVVRDVTEETQAFHILEKRVSERTRQLSALLEVSGKVASTLELKPLLSLVLTQLKNVVDYTGAAITTYENGEFRIVEYQGPVPREYMLQMRIPTEVETGYAVIAKQKEPLIIADIWADDPWLIPLQNQINETTRELYKDIHSWMAVPLIAKGRLIGVLRVDHYESNYFNQQHAQMVMAFADQAAVAIENARLYEQAQSLAALEERQKLARELHDSVSQALYGIALGARTARALLDKDPSKVAEPLDYCLSLAEAGLAEMHALIFELRPESLQTEGLLAALSKQAAATQARYGLQVELKLCAEEPDVPLTAKEALYRIAQEALHNTVKHSRASHVTLAISCIQGEIILLVKDNGIGFKPEKEFPGHLGLKSMRERVERLGGKLTIASQPGEGSEIEASLPIEMGY